MDVQLELKNKASTVDGAEKRDGVLEEPVSSRDKTLEGIDLTRVCQASSGIKQHLRGESGVGGEKLVVVVLLRLFDLVERLESQRSHLAGEGVVRRSHTLSRDHLDCRGGDVGVALSLSFMAWAGEGWAVGVLGSKLELFPRHEVEPVEHKILYFLNQLKDSAHYACS